MGTIELAKQSFCNLQNEILIEDNKKLLKIMMIELLRYATRSKKKIVRKYCWLCIHQILENKYDIPKPRKLKPPKDLLSEGNGDATKEDAVKKVTDERVIVKKKKP